MHRHSFIQRELAAIISLPGDMAEIGVYKGDTSIVLRNSAPPQRVLHLYDTFGQGIVRADSSIDVHGNGEFSDTSVEAVRKILGENNVKYHVGTFPDTFTEQDVQFCFVYSDMDTYFGTKATLDVFAPRMVMGGKIMFDDYEWHECPGVKKAITEFMDLPFSCSRATAMDGTQFMITFGQVV